MSEQTVESLVSSIGSLKGALLVTVDDLLLYRSWQRDGEDWSLELNAARFGDVLRATAGLGQLRGDHAIQQLTIESHDAVTVIEPLNEAIAAVLLFDANTPLGLVRFHLATVREGLQQLASSVGPVGPPASRSASALGAAALPAPTGFGSVVPPPPPPSNPPRSSAPPVGSAVPPPPPASSSEAPPLPPLPVPAPPAGATKPGDTLVTEGAAIKPLPPEPAKVPTAVIEAFEPTEDMPAIGSQSSESIAASIAEEATVDSPYGVQPPYEEPEPSTVNPRTQPRPSRPHRRTSPLPGPIFTTPPKSDLPSGVELLAHLREHAADAHSAMLRVSLLSGVPLASLKDPSRLSEGQIAKIELAARHMLGIDSDRQ
jgi:predicted regulator of Ras-like GTPase activity (Roadblock/LC7/MglB family)